MLVVLVLTVCVGLIGVYFLRPRIKMQKADDYLAAGKNVATITELLHDVNTLGKANLQNGDSAKIAWKFNTNTGDRFNHIASPVISNGTAYFGAGGGYVFGVDVKTGQKKFEYKERSLAVGNPIILDGIIYISFMEGYLVAVDIMSRQEKWRFKTDGLIVCGKAISDGLIYIGSQDGWFYAVDIKSGQEQWKFKTEDGIYGVPLIYKGVAYFSSFGKEGYFHALDIRTCKELWRIKYGVTRTGSDAVKMPMIGLRPTISGDSIYIDVHATGIKNMKFMGDLCAVNIKTGEERWRFEMDDTCNTTVISGGIILVRSGSQGREGCIHAVDIITGREVWNFKTDKLMVDNLSVDDNKVYFGSDNGFLYALDIKSGREQWKYKTENGIQTSIVLYDGMMLYGNKGTLYGLSFTNNQDITNVIDNVTEDSKKQEVDGPPDEIVIAGVRRFCGDVANNHFKRGETLVATEGMNGRPIGTRIYPIKFEGFPVPFYFNQDEFGDWTVREQGMSQSIQIDLPAKSEHPQSLSKEDVQQQPNESAKRSDAEQHTPVVETKTEEVQQQSNISARRSDAERALADVEARIEAERQRWKDATAVINILTNYKRTPVQEGSRAYYRCLEASQIIQEVERGAGGLKAEKARLESIIQSSK